MSIKGLDDFIDVFDLIKNPDKYEAKVNELRTTAANYKEAVEAVVAISEVNDFIINTRKREEESKLELEAAKKASEEIRTKAKEFHKEKSNAIKVAEEELSQAKQIFQAKQEEQNSKAKSLQEVEAALINRSRSLDQREKDILLAQASLKEKQDKLAAALK